MKYSKIFISLLVAILLLACQTSDNKVKVGFLFANFDIPRWGLERDIFTKKINELGGEVLIADAKSDALVQYNQAIDFINKGVDVLVITVANANTAAAIVREAHKKNVKVIAYDGLIYNSDLDYLVGFDLERVGRLLGEYVLDKKPEGNYVIFNGDKAHAAAEEINTGLMEIIKPSIESKKINVVYNGWMEGLVWGKFRVLHRKSA
jgi:D-xylose transport system substrate-binding protein